MFSLLLLLTVQCAQAVPEADFLVEVEVKTATEEAGLQTNVQGATILLNTIEMGKTGTDGRFVGMIRGQEGQEVALDVVPPEGYVLTPDFTKPVATLETETNQAGQVRGKTLDFSILVTQDSYEYMVMVSGAEPNRPVFAGDEELASTDATGTAMVLLPGKAGDTVEVKVMTAGEGQQLLGKSFQLPNTNSVLMITETDVIEDQAALAAKTGGAPAAPSLPDEYNPSQFAGKATGQKISAADLMAAEDAADEAGKAARAAQRSSNEVEQVLAGATQGSRGYSEIQRSASRAGAAATQAQRSSRNATRAARNGDAAMAKAYAQAAATAAAKAAEEIAIANRLLASASAPAPTPAAAPAATADYDRDYAPVSTGSAEEDDILATANQLVKDAMLVARKTSSTTREITTMIRKAKKTTEPEMRKATTEANQIRGKATAASQAANRILTNMRNRGASARTYDNLDKIEGFKSDAELALHDADTLKDRVTGLLSDKPADQGAAAAKGAIKPVELGVCDLEKLTAGVDGDLVPAYLVAACEAISEGHPEYSDANFQLARHYRRNREHKKEQRALQRATGYGRYRHDPSVLFQLIKVSITNHDYQVALSVQDQFLLTHDRLPSSQRMRMVAEMYELFAKAYEFQFYQKHEANPEGDNLDLLDKAIEMWDHFNTYTDNTAKGNREITKLRQLRDEVSK